MGADRPLHRALDPRQDGRPGRARQRRAPGPVRRPVAADDLADRRLAGPPRADRARSADQAPDRPVIGAAARRAAEPSRCRRIAYDRVGRGPALVHAASARRRPPRVGTDRRAPGDRARADHRGSARVRRVTAAARRDPDAGGAGRARWPDCSQSLGIDRPHVAGNSLGGWVALELGLRGATRSTSAIAPAGLWPQPLMPKPSVAHRLAKACGRWSGRSPPPPRPPAAARPAPSPTPTGCRPPTRPTSCAPTPARSGFVAVNRAMRAGRVHGPRQIRGP